MSSFTFTGCSNRIWKARSPASRGPDSPRPSGDLQAFICHARKCAARWRMRILPLAPLLVAAPLGSVASPSPAHPPAPPAATQTADTRLKALYEAYADWDQKESGYFVDSKGENQPSAYLPK